MVVEADPAAEAEAPIADPSLEEPNETLEDGGEDAEEPAAPSLTDQITAESLTQVLEHPLVKEHLGSEYRKVEDRTKNRMIAEQRRRFTDPAVVEETFGALLREAGVDLNGIPRGVRDKAQTLVSTVSAAAAQQLAEAIPDFLFRDYKLDQESIGKYQEAVRGNDTDSAIRALVDGAVASLDQARAATFEQRVKAEVEKRVKDELGEVRPGKQPVKVPTATRGTGPTNTTVSLTTAEIEKMPPDVWRALPAETKALIRANVGEADRTRGAQTVNEAELERVTALAKK